LHGLSIAHVPPPVNAMTEKRIEVLLVEDSPGDARLLREMLADNSQGRFGLKEAASLREATDRLSGKDGCDLILLDLTLPDSEGLGTLQHIMNAAPQAPIIVLTGRNDESLGVESIRIGAQDYLIKGQTEPRLLVRAIRYAIERKRIEDELRQARDELEARVRERTAQLSAVNEGLRNEIAERVRAEEALRESEQRFRAVFDKAAIGIALMALDGQVKHANQALQEMLGYSEEELASTTLASLTYPDDAAKGIKLSNEMIRGRRDFYQLEKRYLRKDGQVVWVDLSISLIRDGAGRPRHAVALMHDVTDRRKTEKEIADLMVNEQRRLGQELHDGLLQQLTGIGMMAKSLHHRLQANASPEAEVVAEFVKIIRHAQEQGRAVIRGLRPVEVDANGLMAALEGLTTSIEKWHGITCRFECNQPVLVEDTHVGTQLFYIAQEALNNAVRHANPKNIFVTLKSDHKELILRVRDDGVGIRGDLSHKRGMGLRIMRYRAGMIGATLDVQAAEGGGTLISCIL
jgi:PAS domain S-box-containing protein